MTHKYLWAEQMARDMTVDFGTTVTIESPRDAVNGQETRSVYDKYQTPAMILQESKTYTDRYKRLDRITITMPVSDNRKPRPGDILTSPSGKSYTVDLVEYLNPAGIDIAYRVQASDG